MLGLQRDGNVPEWSGAALERLLKIILSQERGTGFLLRGEMAQGQPGCESS